MCGMGLEHLFSVVAYDEEIATEDWIQLRPVFGEREGALLPSRGRVRGSRKRRRWFSDGRPTFSGLVTTIPPLAGHVLNDCCQQRDHSCR